MAGAPVGNKNAERAKRWRDSILRALSRRAGNIDAGLDLAADKLVALAVDDGDKWAIEELGLRIDGKPLQSVDTTIETGSNLLGILAGISQSKNP